jgi:hypothetical protein
VHQAAFLAWAQKRVHPAHSKNGGNMRILILIFLILTTSRQANALDISREILDLEPSNEKEIIINVSNNIEIKGTLAKTTKGNGTLDIGNYCLLRIYDTHGDTAYYENQALDVDLNDIDGDGFNEIIISGVVVISTDKEMILAREQLVYIYKYKNGKYVMVYKRAPVEIDLSQPVRRNPMSSNVGRQ